MIKFTPCRRIIIPTSALSVINSLPKPSPFDLIAQLWADAVTQLALLQRTTMIDRALAEDLSRIFGIDVEDVPDTVGEITGFVKEHIIKLLDQESLEDAIASVQGITRSLNRLIVSMTQTFDGPQ